MSHWRYQPVFWLESGEKYYGICETYFDSQDALDKWTDAVKPGGATWDELCSDLTMMLADCYRWRAVNFDELKVGQKFERLISEDQCETIAQMVEIWTQNMKVAQP